MNQRITTNLRIQATINKECHYFQVGRCKYGVNCKFTHSGKPRGFCQDYCLKCKEIKKIQSPFITTYQESFDKLTQLQKKQNFIRNTRQTIQTRPRSQTRPMPRILGETERMQNSLYQRMTNSHITSNQDQSFNSNPTRNSMSGNQIFNRIQNHNTEFSCQNKISINHSASLPQRNEANSKLTGLNKGSKQKNVEEEKLEKEDDSEKACTICLTYKRDHAFIPCGHVALCSQCAKNKSKLDGKCVLCRKNFENVIKVYN